MGSRRSSSGSVSTAVNSADSSPCSAESSFRELDDVFLKVSSAVYDYSYVNILICIFLSIY